MGPLRLPAAPALRRPAARAAKAAALTIRAASGQSVEQVAPQQSTALLVRQLLGATEALAATDPYSAALPDQAARQVAPHQPRAAAMHSPALLARLARVPCSHSLDTQSTSSSVVISTTWLSLLVTRTTWSVASAMLV